MSELLMVDAANSAGTTILIFFPLVVFFALLVAALVGAYLLGRRKGAAQAAERGEEPKS